MCEQLLVVVMFIWFSLNLKVPIISLNPSCERKYIMTKLTLMIFNIRSSYKQLLIQTGFHLQWAIWTMTFKQDPKLLLCNIKE